MWRKHRSALARYILPAPNKLAHRRTCRVEDEARTLTSAVELISASQSIGAGPSGRVPTVLREPFVRCVSRPARICQSDVCRTVTLRIFGWSAVYAQGTDHDRAQASSRCIPTPNHNRGLATIGFPRCRVGTSANEVSRRQPFHKRRRSYPWRPGGAAQKEDECNCAAQPA